jgi:hypothetical protein
MKDEWYGDKRDIVKWSALLHLARKNGLRNILQISYFRKSKWAQIFIDGESNDIQNEVLDHFRDVNDINNIVPNLNVNIFNLILNKRRTYFPKILNAIDEYKDENKIIFLDPDTGLAQGKATLKHVLPSELKEIWQILRGGDLLVLYQHKTTRKRNNWIEEKHKHFAEALSVADDAVKIARSPGIASDVVFFYCRKDDNSTEESAA